MNKDTDLHQPSLLTTILSVALSMSAGNCIADDFDIASQQDAQKFTCDARQGAYYQVRLVSSEQASLEAVVSLHAVTEKTKAVIGNSSNLTPSARLEWSPIETGFSFSGQGFELVGLADVAVLHDGAQAVACRLQEREARTLLAMPARAFSLGGRVRSGPGVDFITRTILSENTPVTLLENTELRMDGYDWFRFEAQEGVEGYQWGGVICTREGLLPGVLGQCE
jgi:hypothetical protein